jgi:hypothetical protein
MLCVCHCRTCKRQHPSGKAEAEEGGVDEGVVVEGGGLVGREGGKQYNILPTAVCEPVGQGVSRGRGRGREGGGRVRRSSGPGRR